jgi:hypothetical protein
MGHNLHGDIPIEDLELANELLAMEAHWEANQDLYGPAMGAKILVCISHDFYELGDDDKGSELLEKANKVCPGYFENEIKRHIDQDPEYAYLVESLTMKILAIAGSLMD